MPFQWKLFRLLCVLQLLLCVIMAGYFASRSLLGGGTIALFLQAGAYVIIVLMASTGIQLMSNNYPDVPLEPLQKKRFNRMFLLNVIALLFLFASLFRSWYNLRIMMARIKPVSVIPVVYYIEPAIHLLILLFQFLMLYGLIALRRELVQYQEAQQFEFEQDR